MTAPRPREADAAPTAPSRAMTLSEERLAISTVRVPSRRVRLEKYVVTETRTITVQVSREEVRLVDVDLPDAGPVDEHAPAGSSGDADRWLTLSEERVVVTTETVPVERVRLEVSTVVEDRVVTDEIRREQIALERGTEFARGTGPGAIPTTTEDTE
ncbi:DUF2382 domain-containing protein [Nakamurella deserti]|uniref:DUF2382 domain-containing protein n=1 Tax=Nakamurella deserti TaxID=2164074 RepID=UPI000DBE15FC|nr:DUF2382 domain-containing protein [Nakamurella deserti]